MSFVPTFPWGRLVLAVGHMDCSDKNEIVVFVFSVTANDFPHEMVPLELSPVYLIFFPPFGHTTQQISVFQTVANQETFSVSSRGIKRRRNKAYPHAEGFLVVIVDLRSYKTTFLTSGVFQWPRRQQNDAHGHQSISAH